MNEREYVKVNTSIQTGSNASSLHTDPEGNVEAVIELRLPDNLFDTNTGTRKLESVDLKTSKLRLSMANTPIAKVPHDPDLSDATKDLIATKMQLDVYPYCLLDNGALYPKPDSDEVISMNYYKKSLHIAAFDLTSGATIREFTGYANDVYNPVSDEALKQLLALKEIEINHMMNVCIQSNHESLEVQDGGIYIRNIGTLEQMLQDAIENAITFGYCHSVINIVFVLCQVDVDDDVVIDGTKYAIQDTRVFTDTTNPLTNAVKPKVTIGAQSLSITYDTAPFGDNVPILWNPGFVDTADMPDQLTLDTLRKDVWGHTPPKRAYTTPIQINSDSTWGYKVPTSIELCSPLNIVVNESTRDTFSFLPWIPYTPKEPTEHTGDGQYLVTEVLALSTERYPVGQSTFIQNYISPGPVLVGQYQAGGFADGTRYYIKYEFDVPIESESDVDGRYNQTIVLNSTTKTTLSMSGAASIWEHSELQEEYNEGWFYISSSSFTTSTYRSNEPKYGYSFLSDIAALSPSSGTTLTNQALENLAMGKYLFVIPSGMGTNFYGAIGESHGTWSSTSPFANPPSYWLEDYQSVIRTVGDDSVHYECRFYVTSNTSGQSIFSLEENSSSSTNTITRTKKKMAHLYEKGRLTTYSSELINGGENVSSNLDTNKLYILDGTPAEVNITAPDLSLTSPPFAYKMTEKIVTMKSAALFEYYTSNYEILTDGTVSADSGTTRFGFPAVSDFALTTGDTSTSYIMLRYEFPEDVVAEVDLTKDSPLYDKPGTIRVSVEYIPSDLNLTPVARNTGGQASISPSGNYVILNDGYTAYNEENNETYYNTEPTPPSVPTNVTYERHVCKTHIHYTSTKLGYMMWREVYNATSTSTMIWPKMANVTPRSFTSDSFCRVIPSMAAMNIGQYRERITPSRPGYQAWKMALHIPQANYPANCKSIYGFVLPNGSREYSGNDNVFAVTQPVIYESGERYAKTYTVTAIEPTYIGNRRLTFTWPDLPMVVLSPIQSIVLTLEGIHVSQEYQPVNMKLPTGSSLTSTLPVIENYYSLAATLRDLHDELVVVKDEFDDTAKYKVSLTGGMQRSIRLTAKYIDKDGSMHQIYVPPNGVFSVQLTFGISYYPTAY